MTNLPETLNVAELRAGQVIWGLSTKGPVEVINVTMVSDSFASLIVRQRDGTVQEITASDKMVFGKENSEQYQLNGDPASFKLAMEATRMGLGGIFDPFVGVSSSNLQALPHQLSAVYGELLERVPLRFLLADEPGAGKTIMAGLLIKELMLRGSLNKCLIIAPGSLTDQWQEELKDKFSLNFQQISRGMFSEAEHLNPFERASLLIGRMDQLSRSQGPIKQRLRETHWDLVIVDEAHRMSASQYGFGGEARKTKRFELGQLVSKQTTHLLLMTATPHAGNQENFHMFLSLLDNDLFAGSFRQGQEKADLSTVMLRRLKEDLVDLSGNPLFPKRSALTLSFQLSEAELKLYEAVTAYVRKEMSRANQIASTNKRAAGNISFALTVLQRRLASSPLAILNSLRRRLEKLESRSKETSQMPSSEDGLLELGMEDPEDLSSFEVEELENSSALVGLSASQSNVELENEISKLRELVEIAKEISASSLDSKWVELQGILKSDYFSPLSAGEAEKLIIFTEHRDTLDYLRQRLSEFFGTSNTFVSIHGGLSRKERLQAQAEFTNNPECLLLIATDAAGEGINLQRAHLMVNYDLPWNPNRIEQRFGRIHRIGQKRECTLWNLVAGNTREGLVYLRLLEKIKLQDQAYSGNLFHVLGGEEVFEGRSLADLLLQAVASEEFDSNQLLETVDSTVTQGSAKLVAEKALLPEISSKFDAKSIADAINDAKARRLSPGFVSEFFKQAYKDLGGTFQEKESNRLRLPNVPSALSRAAANTSESWELATQYERVTFWPNETRLKDAPDAELVAPGSPLLSAVVKATLEKHGDVLKTGAIFIERSEGLGATPYVLACFEQEFVNALDQTRPLDKLVKFAKIRADLSVEFSDVPPYFDYAMPSLAEAEIIRETHLNNMNIQQLVDAGKQQFLTSNLKDFLPQFEEKTTTRLGLLEREVIKRLNQESLYWKNEATAISQGTKSSSTLTAEQAKSTSNEIENRKSKRIAQIQLEKTILPKPVKLISIAIVSPALSSDENGNLNLFNSDQISKGLVERRAVELALRVEQTLGFSAIELPRNNKGYDLESTRPSLGKIFIEVKGRAEGAREFFVTDSEYRFGLTQGEAYILALVKVSNDGLPLDDQIRYIVDPFRGAAINDGHEAHVLNFDHYWNRGRDPLS